MSDMGRFLDAMLFCGCGVGGKSSDYVTYHKLLPHVRLQVPTRICQDPFITMKQANVGFVVRAQSFLSSVSLTIRDTLPGASPWKR